LNLNEQLSVIKTGCQPYFSARLNFRAILGPFYEIPGLLRNSHKNGKYRYFAEKIVLIE